MVRALSVSVPDSASEYPADGWFTTKEVADMVGVNKKTVGYWATELGLEHRPSQRPRDGRGKEFQWSVVCAFIERINRGAEEVPTVDPDNLDGWYTTRSIAEHFSVTIHVVNGWARKGLANRDGSNTKEYQLREVLRFIEAEKRGKKRVLRMKRLTHDERLSVAAQVRECLLDGEYRSFAAVAQPIAEQWGVTSMTVRNCVKLHDSCYPAQAIGTGVTPLNEEQMAAIYGEYREGATLEELARKYKKVRGRIIHILCEQRAKRLAGKEIQYMHHLDFDRPDAYDYNIVKNQKPKSTWVQKEKPPKDAPPDIAVLYSIPQLNKAEEQHLFRRMNYWYHCAVQHQRAEKSTVRGDSKEAYYIEQAENVKRTIIRCNLRLVVSIAKKFKRAGSLTFEELYADGCVGLMNAVKKFDFAKGNKFSTYATWAIRHEILEGIRLRKRDEGQARQLKEETWDRVSHDAKHQEEVDKDREKQQLMSVRMLKLIPDDRDRAMVKEKFGLGGEEPMTNEEIGKRHGVSKARIGQILNRVFGEVHKRAVRTVSSLEQDLEDAGVQYENSLESAAV